MENPPSQNYRKIVSPPSKKTYRNWADLPGDTTLTIFKKIEQLDILNSAQFVCKTWYTLCKDASLWQTIRIHNTHTPFISHRYDAMIIDVVARGGPGLVALDIECFGSDALFACIASRSRKLKHLRIADCRNSSSKALIKALRKLSSLQELELTMCSFKRTVRIIYACSPSLASFKLNKLSTPFACDKEAEAIARRMPDLRHLQLIGNSMRNNGLNAILKGCPRLEVLDLHACFRLDLDGYEKRLSEEFKKLRLPYDSTEDYNYPIVDEDDVISEDEDDSNNQNMKYDDMYYWDEFVFCADSADESSDADSEAAYANFLSCL